MSTVDKLLIGVAAGAILGVLYAPDRGSVTRRKLSRIGNDLRDKFNEITETINDKIDSFKEDAGDLAYEQVDLLETEGSVQPRSWQ